MNNQHFYLYITPFFPTPTSWRGAYCYDFVVALQRQFRSRNVECRVVVMTEGDGSDYEIEGVKVYTFKTKRLPSNIFPFLFKHDNQRSFLKKVETVLHSTRNTLTSNLFASVEVCHCHTANYGVYAEAMKRVNPSCKTLLHHHDLASFGLNMGALRHCWLYNLIEFPILRRMHEQIDCHVFISEASRQSFLSAPDTSWTAYEDYKKQMRGLPWRPVKIKDSLILHNGVDKKIFNEGVEGRGTRAKDGRVFTIGCVGNFSRLKGQDVLMKAMARLAASASLRLCVKIIFVGSGETLEECKRLAHEQEEKFRCTPTPLTYTFKSEVRHEKLADFYRSLDLFVLPSTFEGFGCVYTEAHACGVPFIACEGQGVDDLISADDRDQWLCKQRDPEDLARKIGDYISRVERGEQVEQRLNEDQSIDSLVRRFTDALFRA